MTDYFRKKRKHEDAEVAKRLKIESRHIEAYGLDIEKVLQQVESCLLL